jgi:hypothetical protein
MSPSIFHFNFGADYYTISTVNSYQNKTTLKISQTTFKRLIGKDFFLLFFHQYKAKDNADE